MHASIHPSKLKPFPGAHGTIGYPSRIQSLQAFLHVDDDDDDDGDRDDEYDDDDDDDDIDDYDDGDEVGLIGVTVALVILTMNHLIYVLIRSL